MGEEDHGGKASRRIEESPLSTLLVTVDVKLDHLSEAVLPGLSTDSSSFLSPLHAVRLRRKSHARSVCGAGRRGVL